MVSKFIIHIEISDEIPNPEYLMHRIIGESVQMGKLVKFTYYEKEKIKNVPD